MEALGRVAVVMAIVGLVGTAIMGCDGATANCTSDRAMTVSITSDKDNQFSLVAMGYPWVPSDVSHGTLYGTPPTFKIFAMNDNCGLGQDCYDTFAFTMTYSDTYYAIALTGTDKSGDESWTCDQSTSTGYCGPKTMQCKWSSSDHIYFDLNLC
ncbi:hypothetical protein Pelo_6104 [Pelomyxa schiedti]|nr:hypothetical protein Pelo_6104 [Pelomyxa schiedti]